MVAHHDVPVLAFSNERARSRSVSFLESGPHTLVMHESSAPSSMIGALTPFVTTSPNWLPSRSTAAAQRWSCRHASSDAAPPNEWPTYDGPTEESTEAGS